MYAHRHSWTYISTWSVVVILHDTRTSTHAHSSRLTVINMMARCWQPNTKVTLVETRIQPRCQSALARIKVFRLLPGTASQIVSEEIRLSAYSNIHLARRAAPLPSLMSRSPYKGNFKQAQQHESLLHRPMRLCSPHG